MTKEAINKIELLLEEFDPDKYDRRVGRLAKRKEEYTIKYGKKLAKTLARPIPGVKKMPGVRGLFKDLATLRGLGTRWAGAMRRDDITERRRRNQ
jgi:hypothetical protein